MLKKYKRQYTFHKIANLPWSNLTDDKVINEKYEYLEDKEIVVTEKLDGESVVFDSKHIFTKSGYPRHEYQKELRELYSKIKNSLPYGITFYGEYMKVRKSIYYNSLPCYFILHEMFSSDGMCFSWNKVKRFAADLGISSAPIIYQGEFDKSTLKTLSLEKKSAYGNQCEGYVVRASGAIRIYDLDWEVAKFIRHDFFKSVQHWADKEIVINKIS